MQRSTGQSASRNVTGERPLDLRTARPHASLLDLRLADRAEVECRAERGSASPMVASRSFKSHTHWMGHSACRRRRVRIDTARLRQCSGMSPELLLLLVALSGTPDCIVSRRAGAVTRMEHAVFSGDEVREAAQFVVRLVVGYDQRQPELFKHAIASAIVDISLRVREATDGGLDQCSGMFPDESSLWSPQQYPSSPRP